MSRLIQAIHNVWQYLHYHYLPAHPYILVLNR